MAEERILGLIAGNGRFPFLLLEAARAQGVRVVVAAIREETSQDMDDRAVVDSSVTVEWFSLGELSRLIAYFQRESVRQAVMAGQVRHTQIFSAIRPDWRLAKLLLNLRTRSTDALLGAVARVLSDEGIELISSTTYLEPMLAETGTLTSREPSERERDDAAYGVDVARGLGAFDIGQTVVIADRACVAVEAMEGTDATIRRAAELMRGLEGEASTLARELTVVKVAKPNQDMRFDVPVVGLPTIAAMREARATCLCIPAGKALLFDREGMMAEANAAGISIFAI